MVTISFLFPVLLAVVIYAAARLIDRITSGISRGRFSLAILRAPGVILHELCHGAACILTGAEIRNIVWYNYEDGSGKVVHGPAKVPVIGNFCISVAPFVGGILFLVAMGYCFSSIAGISLVRPETFQVSAEGISGVFDSTLQIFLENLVYSPNPWFLLYMYLLISVLPGLAPSVPDLWNRDVGIIAVLVLAVCGTVIYLQAAWFAETIEAFLAPATSLLSGVLVCEIAALLILVPLFLLCRIFR